MGMGSAPVKDPSKNVDLLDQNSPSKGVEAHFQFLYWLGTFLGILTAV
jgi:hypothetical protein